MNKMQERINDRVWNEELKREEDKAAYELGNAKTKAEQVNASKHYANASKLRDELELVTVDEDDLLDTINEDIDQDISQAVNDLDDSDVLVIDEDDLLDEINRVRAGRAGRDTSRPGPL